MPTAALLQKYSDLPAWRQDNPAILTGYRKETGSWNAIVCGPWIWHNQTVNIWSHLLGALVIVAVILIWTIGSWPAMSASSETWHDRWGLAVFLLGALVCFACSTIFHASSCHSRRVLGIMSRLDYLGILFLGTVNFFPSFHYAFFCDPALRDIYICSMTVSGCTGVYLVLAPTYSIPSYRRMRTYTFFALGVVVVVPFVHCVVRYGLNQASRSLSLHWIVVELFAYVGGALLYAERCPECLAPGKFDIIGSSHQIFHMCSLIAVWAHFMAIRAGYNYWHIERHGSCF
ncbi:hemolysin-III related-domain-containing protein [Mycena floridula]|nr:hemolysin-III related-domain-containing protein [Mycena floridula]